MAGGPWEQYQKAAEARPWEQYAAGRESRVRAQEAEDRARYDPTNDMGTVERLVAGYGSAVPRLVRGVGQRLGVNSQAEVDEANKLDAPLLNSGAGMTGNILGNVAAAVPTVAIPGAATIPGAAVIGGLQGAAVPTSTGESVTRNTLLGAAAGGVATAAGKGVGALLDRRAANIATQQAGNAQKFAAARQGAEAGYVVPPADLEPGVVSSIASGISGKVKTAQEASARNQVVTDRLAREGIGMRAGDELTTEALDVVRADAGKAYQAVAGLGQLEVAAGAKLPASVNVQSARGALMQGEVKRVDAAEVVRAWKQANHDATGYYRAYARDANPETLAKAKAAASAAKEIDGFLSQQIDAMGRPELGSALKEARTLIAKTYNVEKGLNSQTGNVSAQSLAKDLERGKLLSNELLTIAEMGRAFPKATQALKETPKSTSPLDWVAGVGAAAGTSNPLPLLMVGARPLTRNALLSRPVQRQALQQSAPMAPQDNALLQLLRNSVAPQSALSQR